MTDRELNVYNAMKNIYDQTKDGTNHTFAKIFGKAGGDGNVWNMLRMKGWLTSNDKFKYIWHDADTPPSHLSAILISREAIEYVREKKELRDAARASMTHLSDWIGRCEVAVRNKPATITVAHLEMFRSHLDKISEYMNKNNRLPNPEYDGIGSV